MCSYDMASVDERMGMRSICILGSCRSASVSIRPARQRARPSVGRGGLAPAERRDSTSDLAQAQQTDRVQGVVQGRALLWRGVLCVLW